LIDPDTLAKQVVLHYDLPAPVTCSIIKQGDNDNYLLNAAGTNYVLRVYRYNKHWLENESDFLFELDWLSYLKQQGLPVSEPIQRKDGGLLGILPAPEGNRYWTVFTYSDGKSTMDESQSVIFGKTVAQIHTASNNFSSPHHRFVADLEWLIDKPMRRLIDFLSAHRPEVVEQTVRIAEEAKTKIQALDFAGDAFGIIGGDFHGGNHHFTKDNRIAHFDFELCSYGWRAYDIAIFRWARGRFNSLWQGFLKGYESVRPLSAAEREAIPTFVILRQVWLMGSHTTYPTAIGQIRRNHWDDMLTKLETYVSGTFVED
jgi:Ser/Thr protein kinase RdoA (MazF antagonist)